MPSKQTVLPAISLLAVLLFIAGLWHLFVLRFEAGDLFPPYSSLRADPLGTKILFTGLDRLEERVVHRNYDPLSRLTPAPGTTLFFLGARQSDFSLARDEFFESIEMLAAGGERVVIAFFPVSHTESADAEEPVEVVEVEDTAQDTEPAEKESPSPEDEECECPSLADRWGIDFSLFTDFEPGRDTGGGESRLPQATLEADVPLEPAVPWSSRLVFENPDPTWSVLYTLAQAPVVVERPYGMGSMVLLSDSYLLSNEAMLKARAPALLSWLAGGNRAVIFDESHLGVLEHRGIASLARRYRLEGLLFGLFLLGALFLWKSAVSFVPRDARRSPEQQTVATAGRDAHAAFVHLLRRSIRPGELLRYCLKEWEESFPRKTRRRADRVKEAREVVRSGKDPLAGYHRVTRILKGEKS